MTTLREAAQQAKQTPLIDLLERVPENARLRIDEPDGLGSTNIPAGRLCRDAAAALRAANPPVWEQYVVFEDNNGALRKRPEDCQAFGADGQPAAVYVGRQRYVPEPVQTPCDIAEDGVCEALDCCRKLPLILEALEIGYASAEAEAAQYHAAMAGYRPERHAAMDADVAKIAAAITAVKATLAQDSWQPIATAPKTGRKVILFYLNRNSLPRTVMARWVTDEEAAETDGEGVGLEAGWYECIDNWDYTEVAIYEGEPTHWMPLPEAPRKEEA